MKILHIASLNMDPAAGPTYSVPNFVKSQGKIKGNTSNLLITNNIDKQNKEFYYKQNFTSKVEYINFIVSYDLIVFHSTYFVEYVKISKILKREKTPYIIVPRGGFSKKAKKIKKWKKRIGDLFIFNTFFKNADAIQFLTEKEKENSVYRTRNDFVMPNGILMPKINKLERNISKSIKIVYIGRLDPYIKGLDILIEAINLIKEELKKSNVKIDLYGPRIKKSGTYLLNLINKYNLEEILNINEEIFYEEKKEVLLKSHMFIQTSRSEGLPMGVLEALSYGLPCILTPGTNLSKKVSKNYAGIEVAEDPLSVSKGILKLIKKHDDYHVLSKNAKKLAQKYSWNKIGKKSIQEYQKLLNQINN